MHPALVTRQFLAAAACGTRCVACAAMALSGHAALADIDRGGRQLEVTATSMPRFDNQDNGSRSSRIDMTTWSDPRRSSLGLTLGVTSPDTSSAAFASGNRIGLSPPPSPSLDLGVKWRYTLDGNYRLDVTAYRRVMPPDALTLVQTHDEGQYGARVEMALGKSQPRSGFVADRGFLGLQLESGARVTLRRSGGKPMVYYRSRF